MNHSIYNRDAEYIAKTPHSAKYSISYSAELDTFYLYSAEYNIKNITLQFKKCEMH